MVSAHARKVTDTVRHSTARTQKDEGRALPHTLWEPEKNQVILPLVLLCQLCQCLLPILRCVLSIAFLSISGGWPVAACITQVILVNIPAIATTQERAGILTGRVSVILLGTTVALFTCPLHFCHHCMTPTVLRAVRPATGFQVTKTDPFPCKRSYMPALPHMVVPSTRIWWRNYIYYRN